MNLNRNTAHINAETTEEERLQTSNSGGNQADQMTLNSETGSETGPEEIENDIPCAETIRIGLRLPTRDRQHPKVWWKPWEPIRSQDKDEDENTPHNEDTTNSTCKPHGEPKNYAEALEHPDAHAWERATREEMNNHTKNATWSLVPRPENSIVIGSRWVFHLKYNTNGSIKWHKARLVAKGYNQ